MNVLLNQWFMDYGSCRYRCRYPVAIMPQVYKALNTLREIDHGKNPGNPLPLCRYPPASRPEKKFSEILGTVLNISYPEIAGREIKAQGGRPPRLDRLGTEATRGRKAPRDPPETTDNTI